MVVYNWKCPLLTIVQGASSKWIQHYLYVMKSIPINMMMYILALQSDSSDCAVNDCVTLSEYSVRGS